MHIQVHIHIYIYLYIFVEFLFFVLFVCVCFVSCFHIYIPTKNKPLGDVYNPTKNNPLGDISPKIQKSKVQNTKSRYINLYMLSYIVQK